MRPAPGRPIALLFAVGVWTASTAGQQPVPVVISRVNVVDVQRGRIEPDMTLVIRADRIASMEPSSSATVPRGARVIDGHGRFLMPGLWDMHVHLSYARVSALPALVANGITSVRDMGSTLSEIDLWRGQIAAGSVTGPQIVRAGPMLNDREFNRYQLAVANGAEAQTAVRTLHKAGVDFIKLHRRTSREAYAAIAAEARRLALPFAGHVPLIVTPAEASDAGQATIEHTESLFDGTFSTALNGQNTADAIERWRDSADAQALFATFVLNHTAVTPTLVTHRQLLQWLDSPAADARAQYVAASARRGSEEQFAPMRAHAAELATQERMMLQQFGPVVGMMARAGVTLLAGTDLASSVIYPGFSLHDELAELVMAGLTPLDALRAATLNAAALFPALRRGVIAAGNAADLVLLDANPLDNIRHASRIRAVVLRGQVVDRAALDKLLVQAADWARTN